MFERNRIAPTEVIEERLEMSEQPGGEEKLMQALAEEKAEADKVTRRSVLRSTVVGFIALASGVMDLRDDGRRQRFIKKFEDDQKIREQHRQYTNPSQRRIR